MECENGNSYGPLKEEGLCLLSGKGSVIHIIQKKVYLLKKALYGLKEAPRACYDWTFQLLIVQRLTKGLQITESPKGIFNQSGKNIRVILLVFTMKMEILLDVTSKQATDRMELEVRVRSLQETIGRVTVEKEKSFHTLKASKAEVAQRHGDEVIGFKGRIVKLEVKVKHVNDDLVVAVEPNFENYARVIYYKAEKEKLKMGMSLGAHNLSAKIYEKCPKVPEVELKLDGNVVVKVADKAVALSTKSWPYCFGDHNK
ncbi:hypothetical protein Tco_1156091 [Tanacetum coccineum]